MRSIFLCLFFAIAVAAVNAQNSVFIKAGLNLANVSISDNGSVDDAKVLPSFHVGLQGDFPVVNKIISLQPGIFFTGKGSKTQAGNTTDASYYRATSNPMYIEVPVNVVFKLPLSDKSSSFFFGAGPYAAMGVGGRNKAEGKIFGVSFNSDEKIDFSNDDPTTSQEEGTGFGIMRRFDYGVNGTVGFEGEKTMISVNYGLGLAKLQSGTNSNENDKNKHRVLSFTIGFRL
ncbi:MAG: outer membrane beta-barrel protein [Lacibacter sp.]